MWSGRGGGIGSDEPDHVERDDLEADFSKQPSAETEHFFVDVDPSDDAAAEEGVAGFDPSQEQPQSITHFL